MTTVVLIEKKENGEMVAVDERAWSGELLATLNYANYLTLDDKEYEMVEGRLNVNLGKLELLVVPIKK